jgi:hypothetical protein
MSVKLSVSYYRVFKNRVRRIIFGSKKSGDAKSLTLSWLSHLERMETERTPKYLLKSELFGVRRRGRPRKRWLQDVKDNLR